METGISCAYHLIDFLSCLLPNIPIYMPLSYKTIGAFLFLGMNAMK